MNEMRWLTCNNPEEMLDFLGHKNTAGAALQERKLRLFGCAKFRTVGVDSGPLLEQIERWIDGEADKPPTSWHLCNKNPWQAARFFTDDRTRGCLREPEVLTCTKEVLSALIRDVFGNPFHSKPFAESWRTNDAVRLAQVAYHERTEGWFDNKTLRVLSDELEDAGCNDRHVLNHLRMTDLGPCPERLKDRTHFKCVICHGQLLFPVRHARGCWVIDKVLGKS